MIVNKGRNKKEKKIFAPKAMVFAKSQDVDCHTALILIRQIRKKPDSILTLPTGVTPIGLYQKLTEAFEQGLDFKRLKIFNLDEYWPIRKDNSSSYASYMLNNLIKKTNLKKENWQIPNGEAGDPYQEAERYDFLLKNTQPVDIAVVGIGPEKTCHIGFNEKGSTLDSRTRYVFLSGETRRANAVFFNNPEEVPKGAITQGIANILEAEKILLMAKGEVKAWGVKRALKGLINSDAPASFLRCHQNVIFILDKKAAVFL